MAATLSHSAHAIHAQTTSPIHDAPAYEHADLQLHPTTPQPLSHDSAHHLQSITSAIMDTEDHLTPGPIIPHSPSVPPGHSSPPIHDDSNMEGAGGTAADPSLAVNPWLQPVQPIFDGRVRISPSPPLRLLHSSHCTPSLHPTAVRPCTTC